MVVHAPGTFFMDGAAAVSQRPLSPGHRTNRRHARRERLIADRIPGCRRADDREGGRLRGLSDRALAWLFITPHDRAAAGDQHLSPDLDDLSVVYQLPRQPGECSDEDGSGSIGTSRS